MKKIPTIFVRDMSTRPSLVIPEWKPECEWVRNGEGIPFRKYDGTCCMMRDGLLYRRREMKFGQKAPDFFELVDTDEQTGKSVGWVPIGIGPDDAYHREAAAFLEDKSDGTYELIGPKVQGNKHGVSRHRLIRHAQAEYITDDPRSFEEIRNYLSERRPDIEGIVWHHNDGRMAKIKRKDFGLKW